MAHYVAALYTQLAHEGIYIMASLDRYLIMYIGFSLCLKPYLKDI